MNRRRFLLALLVSLIVVTIGNADAQVTEIPPLVAGESCWSKDINDHDEVLVQCLTNGTWGNTFIWSLNSFSATPIPKLTTQDPSQHCLDINQLHQVLCQRGSDSSYLWLPTTQSFVVLDGLVGTALNDVGDVLGVVIGTGQRVIRRYSDGTWISVPASPLAWVINNLMQVPLTLNGVKGLWSPNPDVGFVPFAPQPPSTLSFEWINDVGQVVGTLSAGGPASNYLYRVTPGGEGWVQVTSPATMPGANSYGGRLNDLGQVAATAFTPAINPYTEHAVFWPAQPVDLGSYNGALTYAVKVNNSGVVAGAAYGDGTIPTRPLIWHTTPPPPTQQIESVQSQINTLLSGGQLSTGDAASFSSKLDAATQAVNRGETSAAKNILSATMNQVNALLKSKRITQATADRLKNLLNAAIGSL